VEDEIDISRGDMLVPPSHPPHVTRRIDARIVWMHETALKPERTYLLRHTTQTVRATVKAVRYRIDINTLEKDSPAALQLNDIGAVVIETQKPLFCDPYRRNRSTGSFILMDPISNATVAAGMITGREPARIGAGVASAEPSDRGRVTRTERELCAGHPGMTFWLETAPEIALRVERMLFDAGRLVHTLLASECLAHVPQIARVLNETGVIALLCGPADGDILERTREQVGVQRFVTIEPPAEGESPEEAAERIRQIIEEQLSVPPNSD